MDENEKMNVLVLGNSGVGKSTLIRAVAGEKVAAGDITPDIAVYDSSIWPIRFIDTKGFESNIFEQLKTIRQINKFTRSQTSPDSDDDSGIDAVWYCIDGTSKRLFDYNIELMSRAVKGWRNVPVFAVITKSYSEAEDAENIELVSRAFARGKGHNLRKIIPVVAERYKINDEFTVEPKGIEELCAATVNCMPEAKITNSLNRSRMVIEQRRFTANMLTAGATAAAAIIGAVPVPFADSLVLVPLEIGLTKGIFKAYKVDFSGELVTGIVGSTAITNIAKAALSALKAVPIAGSVLNAVVAGFFVAALGESEILLSENICSGKLDVSKVDSAIEFIGEKLRDNAALGFAVRYLEDNAKELSGKSAKEISERIGSALKKQNKNQ